jgi:hypothetical protein
MKLTPERRHVLEALSQGCTLKAHRTVDGAKTHLLHPLEGAPVVVDTAVVTWLADHDFIRSNMKFPAATYLLTEQGLAVLRSPADPTNLLSTLRDG